MKRFNIHLLLAALPCLFATSVYAGGMEDDPVLVGVFVDELEWRDSSPHDAWVWDAQGWVGKDLNKFWWKAEGEAENGQIEDAEIQLLHSRAISTYWDIQYGLRSDLEPATGRNWGVIGVQGLAPYFFEVDAALFVGSSGRLGARISAEYEFMFSQRLALVPELEINAFSKDDLRNDIGSGLASAEFGLRLSYAIRREFAPYIGINWERKLGGTADIARNNGERVSDTQFMIGLRAWY